MLKASTQKKEDLEKVVFERRYTLAVQKAASVQLERVLDDATQAVSHLLDVRTHSFLFSLSLSLNIFIHHEW